MKAICCGLAVLVSAPVLAREKIATASPDPHVMAAAGCVVDAKALVPMPSTIGRARLPAGVNAKLRMLGNARPSRAKIEWTYSDISSKDGKKSLLGVRERRQGRSTQAPICKAMDAQWFVRGAGNGTMRHAVVALAIAPLDIWRAFSDTPSFCGHSKTEGAWWSLSDPRKLGKAAARRRNGVCVSWNKMNQIVHCKLRPGAPLAIGPSESVSRETCSCQASTRREIGDGVDDAYVASDSYPADDSTLQVYINVRLAGGLEPLMTCDAPTTWPDAHDMPPTRKRSNRVGSR